MAFGWIILTSALGAQTTCLASGMLCAGFSDHLFDVERLALSGIKFAPADFNGGAQLTHRINALEQFATDPLLCGFWKRGRLYGT
jgi:hypothetical protein